MKLRLALPAVAAALLVVSPAGGALVAPTLVGPADGVTVDALPAFKWKAVTGADHYEFEVSANSGFTSVVYSVTTTKNTRAAFKTAQPNGTYDWRVRAVTSAGALGAWSEVRSFDLAWTAKPADLSPASGADITYPADALKLSWSAVPGASTYRVEIATDSALGSLIWAEPFETPATNYALNTPLAPGTYYWAVTPLDAQGHGGTPSTLSSFDWVWPTTMSSAPTVTDLVAAEEVFDPQLSWPVVPGAAGYEVEINFAPAPDWPTGSKICCDALSFFTEATTLGTSFSPPVVLDNTKTYRWRVRALDASGNAGDWNEGPAFTKPFDNVPPVTAPSVKNLHMRDNLADPATDTNVVTSVLDTDAPVAVWDPVPGASGYEVSVALHNGIGCDWATAPWLKDTATPAWTPLGWSRVIGDGPWPSGGAPSTDTQSLVAGQSYCVRVRAVDRPSTTSGPTVYGDWTYLGGNNAAAFRWNGPPASAACPAPCQMTGSDYVTPLTGTTETRMPLFTWSPIAGAESYYVVVAQDANFTNVVDYAYTRIPAYAPRKSIRSLGYADDANLHWAVLPADNPNGSGVYGDLLASAGQTFAKQSAPPTLVGPVSNATVVKPATTFRWNPVAEGVRRYRIQVSQDPTFAETLEDTVTDSTAYTSSETYLSDTNLYWRVRADAESGSAYIGLPWSATGTFKKQLPRPSWDSDNPASGAGIPALSWSTVPGAISYDIEVEEPDGDRTVYKGYPTHAVSWKRFSGVGITKVWVRANFPTSTTGVVNGPWSTDFWSYAHTMPAPANATEEAGTSRLLLTWDPRFAAEKYRVQISSRADFGTTVETATTETAGFASLLSSFGYGSGGTFYWRAAMIDADANQGDFTAPRSFTLPAPTSSGGTTTAKSIFLVSVSGYPVKHRRRTVTLTVLNRANAKPVPGAKVRVSGAGVTRKTKTTGSLGKVRFRIRAKRYPGRVTFRITKSGFTTKYVYRTVLRR